MRKRIRELAHGKIAYKNSSLIMSQDKINLEVLEGGMVSGEFSFHSETDDVVRGNVYSSMPRMECLTPVFDGRKITIRYEFNSSGLNEGDVLKGDFFIVSDHGEYNLSFAVSVLNPRAGSSVGNIKNLDDFVNLYKDYSGEAVKIFYSSYFHHVIKNEDEHIRNLYDALKGPNRGTSNIEEFLVESGLKKSIELYCPRREFEYNSLTDNCSEIVEISRNTWGCVSIKINSDAPFIEFSKDVITEADFIGMTCYLPMVICADKMHPGVNFGRIILKSNLWQTEVTVSASADSDTRYVKTPEDHRKAICIELGHLYTDYRLGKIVTGRWSENSI
ncbi:MAG: DUF5717 family protein, partial [Lachnospiraceae bacterium]|nr:DUF5717 family protein [Lachnospiraceae bacterium]